MSTDANATPFRQTIADLFKARFPILYIQTWEEERLLGELRALAGDEALIRTVRRLYTWSRTRGFVEDGHVGRFDVHDPLDAIHEAMQLDEPAIFVLHDFHPYLEAQEHTRRALRELAAHLRHCDEPKNVVIVAPALEVPVELEKDVYVVDYPLPSTGELRALLRQMIEVNGENERITIDVDGEVEERLTKAALGLTMQEAENAFARAMVNDARLDADDLAMILEEKRQAIRKTEILEFVKPASTMQDIGGLDNLKMWLDKRTGAWTDAAREYGLPHPKGVLITGVPGCGKSLTAKCISDLWQLPLLRLDVGRIFNKWLGNSEANMRAALKTAETLAPSVLWIDELEKGFGDAEQGGGTTSRIFGTLLTWMQENTKPVFVVATANAIERLAPEFLRKGRFDEIFFVDLPTAGERRDIWRLHLERRLVHPKARGELRVDDGLLEHLTEVSEGYSGAEIEQAVIAALFEAFAEDRALTTADLSRAIRTTVPLSVTQAERVAAARQWADTRAVAASRPEPRAVVPGQENADSNGPFSSPSAPGGRQLDI